MKYLSSLKNTLKSYLPYYEIYRIFKVEPNDLPVIHCQDFEFISIDEKDMNNQSLFTQTKHYAIDDSYGFALTDNGVIIAIQWFWFGDKAQKLNITSNLASTAISMHIQVNKTYINQGVASTLKSLSIRAMFKKGFQKVYSRVWHNHYASIAMNHKINAKEVGWQIKFFHKTFTLKKPFLLTDIK